MKPETLDALLIDRELGELPSDVIELLDSYLQLAPPARRQAEVMARTVGTARETLRRFPELARGTEVQSPPNVTPPAQWLAPWLARAAVIVAVAAVGGWLGYRAGINSSSVESARPNETSGAQTVASRQGGADRKDLWARYNVAFDRHRGTFTIAVEP